MVEGAPKNHVAIVLEFPSTAVDNNVGAVLLSEEISESLFSDGYDSDGLLPCYVEQGEDMIKLEQYNSTQPGQEVGANGIAKGGGGGGGDDGEQFDFLSDNDIKKLRVDGLRKELKSRGLGTGGLKQDLVDRLKKAMSDKDK